MPRLFLGLEGESVFAVDAFVAGGLELDEFVFGGFLVAVSTLLVVAGLSTGGAAEGGSRFGGC